MTCPVDNATASIMPWPSSILLLEKNYNTNYYDQNDANNLEADHLPQDDHLPQEQEHEQGPRQIEYNQQQGQGGDRQQQEQGEQQHQQQLNNNNNSSSTNSSSSNGSDNGNVDKDEMSKHGPLFLSFLLFRLFYRMIGRYIWNGTIPMAVWKSIVDYWDDWMIVLLLKYVPVYITMQYQKLYQGIHFCSIKFRSSRACQRATLISKFGTFLAVIYALELCYLTCFPWNPDLSSNDIMSWKDMMSTAADSATRDSTRTDLSSNDSTQTGSSSNDSTQTSPSSNDYYDDENTTSTYLFFEHLNISMWSTIVIVLVGMSHFISLLRHGYMFHFVVGGSPTSTTTNGSHHTNDNYYDSNNNHSSHHNIDDDGHDIINNTEHYSSQSTPIDASFSTSHRPHDKNSRHVASRALDILIYGTTLLACLEFVCIKTGFVVQSMFGLSGLGTLVVSLASRELVAEYLAYWAIRSSHMYKTGDQIWLFTNNKPTQGIVQSMGWLHTMIRLGDEKIIRIPNSLVARAPRMANLTRTTRSQVRQSLYVRYDQWEKLPALCKDILNEIKRTCPKVVADGSRPFRAQWRDFANSYLIIVVDAHFDQRPACNGYWVLREQVLQAIMRTCVRHEIQFVHEGHNVYNMTMEASVPLGRSSTMGDGF